MLGRREHVYGDDAAGFVAVFGEVFEVSCEGCRVAGDVDDLLWVQGDHGREELLVASASRRPMKTTSALSPASAIWRMKTPASLL